MSRKISENVVRNSVTVINREINDVAMGNTSGGMSGRGGSSCSLPEITISTSETSGV